MPETLGELFDRVRTSTRPRPSQERLAAVVGAKQSYYRKIERGGLLPNTDTAVQLGDFLGIPRDEVIAALRYSWTVRKETRRRSTPPSNGSEFAPERAPQQGGADDGQAPYRVQERVADEPSVDELVAELETLLAAENSRVQRGQELLGRIRRTIAERPAAGAGLHPTKRRHSSKTVRRKSPRKGGRRS